MHIKSLVLQDFRNHRSATFVVAPEATVIVGQNGQGKTSIVEALSLLSTGESFRATKVEEMISFEAELARVKAHVVHHDGEETELAMILTRGLVQGKRTTGRLYEVNGVRRRKQDLVGQLLTVVFRPEDLRLVEGSPGRRRSFLDHALIQAHPQFGRALTAYEQFFKRRNKLLQQVRDGEQPATVLSYWNQGVLKHGELVQQFRRDYLGSFTDQDFVTPLEVRYLPSVMSEARQAEYLQKEIMVGHSLIGPQKDDFDVVRLFQKNEEPQSLALYGSRGQQRLGVLWLKLCQLRYLEQVTGRTPVLFLDDILSELDEQSRHQVFGLLRARQTVITTTDTTVVDRVTQEVPAALVITL